MNDERWKQRARVLAENQHESSSWCDEKARLILNLGREMADARAEEIAQAIEWSWMHEKNAGMGEGFNSGLRCGIYTARSTITKPKTRTREQVLQEALQDVIYNAPVDSDEALIARRALAWTPDGATTTDRRCRCDPPPIGVLTSCPPQCPKCRGTL